MLVCVHLLSSIAVTAPERESLSVRFTSKSVSCVRSSVFRWYCGIEWGISLSHRFHLLYYTILLYMTHPISCKLILHSHRCARHPFAPRKHTHIYIPSLIDILQQQLYYYCCCLFNAILSPPLCRPSATLSLVTVTVERGCAY